MNLLLQKYVPGAFFLLLILILRTWTLNEPVPGYAKVFTQKALEKETTDIPGAVKLYERAVYHDPHLADPFLYLGMIYMDQNNRGLALKYFKKVTKLNPTGRKFGQAYFEVGKDLLENKHPLKAIEYLRTALTLDIYIPEGYYYLGYAYVLTGNKKEAIKQLHILNNCTLASNECSLMMTPLKDKLQNLINEQN